MQVRVQPLGGVGLIKPGQQLDVPLRAGSELWPMYSISSRSVYPAAIKKLAYVCRHSWSVIGSSPAAAQRLRALSAILPEVTDGGHSSPFPRPVSHELAEEDRTQWLGDRRTPTRPRLAPGLPHEEAVAVELDVGPIEALDLRPPEPRVERKRIRNSVGRI